MLALLLLLVVVVIGSAGMVAVLGWLHQRLARLEGHGPAEAGRIAGEGNDLREQVRLLEDEVERLTERVDFTEKLLERPRGESGGRD